MAVIWVLGICQTDIVLIAPPTLAAEIEARRLQRVRAKRCGWPPAPARPWTPPVIRYSPGRRRRREGSRQWQEQGRPSSLRIGLQASSRAQASASTKASRRGSEGSTTGAASSVDGARWLAGCLCRAPSGRVTVAQHAPVSRNRLEPGRLASNVRGQVDLQPIGRNLPGVTSAEVIRRITAAGWHLVRTKGSHRHFSNASRPGIVTVPHPKKDLPIGTLKSIEKQSGVNLT
jgi:predicted RNA binding protein YcfA (HicA-like mRNA interferase family)